MAADALTATLIGDIVESKRSQDRAGLQKSLHAALETANALLEPTQRLEPTVGDEFQGRFTSVATAARASLLLRLALLQDGGADSRYGLGYGTVTVFETTRFPVAQDGPGWWSARAAIDHAKTLSSSPRTSFARTYSYSWAEDTASDSSSEVSAVNAFLLSRDATIDRMTPRGRRLLLGLLLSRPQSQLAADEAITQSAVSQGLRRSGGFAIEIAQRHLEGETA